MEKRHVTSKNLQSIHNNKVICEEHNEVFKERSRIYVKPLDDTDRSIYIKPDKKRLVISIKHKPPVIKTLYKGEETNISSTNESLLTVEDYSSLSSHECKSYKNSTSTITTTSISVKQRKHKSYLHKNRQIESTSLSTVNSDSTSQDSTEVRHTKVEPCSAYAQSPQIMTFPKIEDCTAFRRQQNPENTLQTEKLLNDQTSPTASDLQNLYKKINYIEEKILEQEMVLRSIHRYFAKSSTGREARRDNEPAYNERACCSYIEYSHIPGTSAFQRLSQQSHLGQENAPRKGRAEKYGQDLTLYDNVTARGRRQSASVPGKRNDAKYAADRVHKIRHKLNPVRDYRLMDTVHYLAQGEFAPRDDGIKLTPSREAVLSDIIWEDVCRTHWPNTRLARQHRERRERRTDLQNLIDSLLRERVAHVERKRRRHYRIVKLNHRHDTVRALGKIGDIIVASNKQGHQSEDKYSKDIKNCHTGNPDLSKSREKLTRSRQSREHDSPGPSHIAKEPTYCYRASNSKSSGSSNIYYALNDKNPEGMSNCSIASKAPRFVIKKKTSDVKHRSDIRNLDHFILLPTLVVRTPSNLKRQRKFNELYHKILKTQMQKDQTDIASKHNDAGKSSPQKKDIGLNFDINLSECEEELLKTEEL